MVVDRTGVISHCNDAGAELYGVDPYDVVGRSVQSLRLEPDHQSRVPSALTELADTGRWQGELGIYNARGALLRLDVRATLLRDDDDEPAGFTLACVDIGARVDAERRAARTEMRLRVAHRLVKMGAWEWDPQRDVLHASEAFAAELGVLPGTVLRIGHALDAMPDEDRGRVSAELDRLVRGECDSASVEYRIRRPDGEVRSLHAYCEAIRASGGQTTAIHGTTQDITSRVDAAEELRVAAARARAELDSSPLTRSSRGGYMKAVADCMGEGLFTLDAEGRVTYMNRAAQELLGRNLGEVYGQVMHELAHHHTAHGARNPADSCPIAIAGREGRLAEGKLSDRQHSRNRERQNAVHGNPLNDVLVGPVDVLEGVQHGQARFAAARPNRKRSTRFSTPSSRSTPWEPRRDARGIRRPRARRGERLLRPRVEPRHRRAVPHRVVKRADIPERAAAPARLVRAPPRRPALRPHA